MAAQQQNPMKMGLAPDLTSLTMSVFSPMAAMAMTMKNLLASFKKLVTAAGMGSTVVMTEAIRNSSTNQGKILPMFTRAPPCFPSRRVRTRASTRVMGMMARVRVIFTMAAVSRVLAPGCIPSQAEAAAVTEEVSFTAVPAKRPKPSLERPRAPPRVGKIRAAMTLNRKMTEMAWAISASSAPMTGAVAAMALPPQMEDPTPMRVEMFRSICRTLYRM